MSRSTTSRSAARSAWRSTARRSSRRCCSAMARVANSFIPAGALYHNDANPTCPYDPDAAGKLLAQAGVGRPRAQAPDRCRQQQRRADRRPGQGHARQGRHRHHDREGGAGPGMGQHGRRRLRPLAQLLDQRHHRSGREGDLQPLRQGREQVLLHQLQQPEGDRADRPGPGRRWTRTSAARSTTRCRRPHPTRINWVDLYYSPFRNASRAYVKGFYQNPTGRFMLEDTDIVK